MINWRLNYIQTQKQFMRYLYHAIKICKRQTHSKETVKYKKHLHTKSKWMTNELLRSIKMKDKLYKTLLQTTVNTDLCIALKTEFKCYQSIREAKYLYYTKTFALYKGDMKHTWSEFNLYFISVSQNNCK